MTQFSLFTDTPDCIKPVTENRSDRSDIRSDNTLYVAVTIICTQCKQNTKIAKHQAIHTLEYMMLNWNHKGDNNFEITGTCSRKCEQAALKTEKI